MPAGETHICHRAVIRIPNPQPSLQYNRDTSDGSLTVVLGEFGDVTASGLGWVVDGSLDKVLLYKLYLKNSC